MRRIVLLVCAIVAVWIATKNRTSSSLDPNSTPVTATTAAPASQATGQANGSDRGSVTSAISSGKGFRSRERLDEHYAKHGGEFDGASEAQYLALAQTLRDTPAGGNVLEIVRLVDGVVSRFDKKSGAFLAFDRDGTIRTFFKPNDGERYFRRQANRPPSP